MKGVWGLPLRHISNLHMSGYEKSKFQYVSKYLMCAPEGEAAVGATPNTAPSRNTEQTKSKRTQFFLGRSGGRDMYFGARPGTFAERGKAEEPVELSLGE